MKLFGFLLVLPFLFPAAVWGQNQSITNRATGTSVDLNFRDFADTTDDDMVHGSLSLNCTDTGSGSEDCTLVFQVANAGTPQTMLTFVGGAGNNNSKVVFLSDSVGTDEITENAIKADELNAITMPVDLCGLNAENGTTFFGPHLTDNWLEAENDITDGSIGGTLCDNLSNTSEGSADAPLPGIGAYKVLGMYCITDGTLGSAETLVFTARSAVADLTPSVTCSLAEGETSCVSVVGSSTDIAAGATVAIEVIQSSDNSDDNSWCRLYISPKTGAF